MPDWQLFLSEVLNVDWWWWRLFPADIRQAVTQQLLAETHVSWRVCAHDKSMRKAARCAFFQIRWNHQLGGNVQGLFED